MAVVNLGNPNRAAQAPAKVVLMIRVLGRIDVIVEPRICVQLVVVQDVKRRAMERVGARLRGETLNAPRGAAEFGGESRGGNLELADRFDGRRIFIEGRSEFSVGDTGAVENNLRTQVLAASQLGFKNT